MNWYKIAKNWNARSFCIGYCSEFAIALHEVTGWPFVVFNEIVEDDGEEYGLLVHVALKSPNGKYADSKGFRTEQEIASNLLSTDAIPLKEYKTEEVSENDLYASTEINEEAIGEAQNFILKNHKLWGF